MKCPKCDNVLPDGAKKCPVCHTQIQTKASEESFTEPAGQDTRRFAAIDPNKDSYDFDLQYTLTFKDAGEIRQSIEDLEIDLEDRSEQLLHPEGVKEEKAKPEHKEATREEMEEAAERAALRRERRKGGKGAGIGKIHKVPRKSRTEREKESALKKAKPRKERTEKDAKKSRRLIVGVVVAAVVIALIIGAINLFAGMFRGDTHYPTVYMKGNQLWMVYDKKPQQLSENFISNNTAPALTSEKKTTSDDDDDDEDTVSTKKKVTDPKRYVPAAATEKQLVNISADGMHIFFLENVDYRTGCGDLVYYKSDSAKSKQVIATGVYYKVRTSKDGKSVLYLTGADATGYHGQLFYWTAGQKDSTAVEGDICTDNFVFAQNGMAVYYIRNFNPIVNTGDLYMRAFGKDASGENKQVDEKVAFIFGTTPKSDVCVYAKDYDTKTGTYNLYAKKENEEARKYTEKAFLAPVLPEKKEAVYAYSNYHDNFQAISYIDIATGQVSPMAEDITQIERIRNDEAAVIYSKTYETNKTDYYVIGVGENASQKVANAVVTPADKNRVQFDVSDDFSRVAYITDYDDVNGKGALFTLSIINNYVGTEKRLSDNAYSCNVSDDGAVVRFAADYNKDAGQVSLLAFSNSNTVTLAEEVSSGAFTYDRTGEVVVYATKVQLTPYVSGDIQCVTNKGKVREIDTAVESYGLKQDGNILLLKHADGADGGKLYYSNKKGQKPKLIDEGVTKPLHY